MESQQIPSIEPYLKIAWCQAFAPRTLIQALVPVNFDLTHLTVIRSLGLATVAPWPYGIGEWEAFGPVALPVLRAATTVVIRFVNRQRKLLEWSRLAGLLLALRSG